MTKSAQHLLERHPGFDLLARFEAALDGGRILACEAHDLLHRMESAIMTLEDEAAARCAA